MPRPKNPNFEDYPLYRRAYNLHATIKHRCMKKNIPMDLDVEWVYSKLKGKCEVTGLSFKLDAVGKNYKTRHQLSPSVDRIVPDLGYVKSNCRMVIWWFNCAKQTYNDFDLWHLCNLVVSSIDVNDALNARKAEETRVKTISPSTTTDTPGAMPVNIINHRMF